MLIVDRRMALCRAVRGIAASARDRAPQAHAGRVDGAVRPVWRDGLPLVLGNGAWSKGRPLTSARPGRTDLGCCSRLTDQAAANQLGLSMRTVQRRSGP